MRPLFITLSLVALVLGGVALPTAPASANSVLEDGIVFPQDAEATTFANTWGAPRSGGRRHQGTDLMSPKLTPVYAVADGVVSRLHHSRLGGYGMWIDHGDGVTSVYIHLNNDTPGTDDGRGYPAWTYAPGIEVGTAVEAGQFIAWVGDSGNAERTAPHTHFELLVGGGKVNPYPYLRPAWETALMDAEPAFSPLELLLIVQRQEAVPVTDTYTD
ncbi:MAG: M23 family metallopeptidase [Acidimicrobiia bacterium]